MTPIDRERAMVLEDEHVLAITIYGEARGEPTEGKIAVGNVVKNRAKDNRWPKTIREVCIQPKQFSCWNDSDPNYELLHRKLWAIKGVDQDPVWRECLWVAFGIVKNYLSDNTSGANHYFAMSIPQPKWAREMVETDRIGRHIFMKG